MSGPWSTAYEIREILNLLKNFDFQILHTYRENNQAADLLAKQKDLEFDSSFFPCRLKSIVRSDKMGLCNIRVKKV